LIRPFATSLVAGLFLLAGALTGAGEVIPVVHNEPITVRILSGTDGRPFVHLHLILIGGYDQSDLQSQFFREEVLTDAHGQVRLSNQLANLPWLQISVKKKLCQANARGASFSVEQIRRDGLSASNRCGTATVDNAPGVFTVFIKGEGRVPAEAVTAPLAKSAPKLAASAGSCDCPKKLGRMVSVCNRLGLALEGFSRSFR
jgi:hypothetical protein